MSLTTNTSRAFGALILTFTLAAGTGCNNEAPSEYTHECGGQNMRYMGLVEDPLTNETFAVIRNTIHGCGPGGVLLVNKQNVYDILNGAGHKAGMQAIEELQNSQDAQDHTSLNEQVPRIN